MSGASTPATRGAWSDMNSRTLIPQSKAMKDNERLPVHLRTFDRDSTHLFARQATPALIYLLKIVSAQSFLQAETRTVAPDSGTAHIPISTQEPAAGGGIPVLSSHDFFTAPKKSL